MVLAGSAADRFPFTRRVDMAAVERDAVLARTAALLELSQRLGATAEFSWCPVSDEFSCSEQLYRMLGIEEQLPVNSATLLSRVWPEDRSALRLHLEEARGGGEFIHEFRVLLPDRTLRQMRLAARAVADAQGWRDIIGVVQDVTSQRQCAEDLQKARTDLAYAARVLNLGALSASIAHEIKQPLSGIITNSSTCLRMLAADPPDFAGARETARRTLRDGNRASDIITRLRALFTKKTTSGETVDLNQLAQEAVTLALSDLQRHRITVRTHLAQDLPTVRGDRIQLHQVILNLILNAAEAMSAIDERPRLLTIRTQCEGRERVRVCVEDTGTGFAAHESRLFEPFYTTKSEGMGIGLSISHAIIGSHGGRLAATANEGPGATFCFSIPCAQPGATPIM